MKNCFSCPSRRCVLLAATIVILASGPVLADTVYWTDKDSNLVQQRNRDGSGSIEPLYNLSQGADDPRGIALDVAAGHLFFAGNDNNAIYRGSMDGSGTPVNLNIPGLDYLADIALDLAGRKIYWADRDANRIRRANLDGSVVEDVVSSGVSQPYYIALDIADEKVYWADFDSGIIHRANLDGTGGTSFITGQSRVRDVELDLVNEKIYWTDRDASEVRRADLDNPGFIETLYGPVGLGRPHGLALDIEGEMLYWTDTTLGSIFRGSLDGDMLREPVALGLAGPWGVALDTEPIPEPSTACLAACGAGVWAAWSLRRRRRSTGAKPLSR